MSDEPITRLLQQWRSGHVEALDQLTPLVYEELRLRARAAFRAESKDHTLQPTALVHELYGRLAPANVNWQDRSHFYALCSRMMRRILVDHAKARNAAKRGGNSHHVSLDTEPSADSANHEDLLSLDRALEKLSSLDERKAELLDLQIFGGLTFRELEEVTGLSSSTLDRDLRFARSWLKTQLSAV
ncbi:sigma-70 family RNA polymerase sigma factor [Seongchinamella sediminis]|uniref:Sigma-70 family RNA polymerase sigma factor n=1 Tax=Seongchinamella sediminis TaxID=2283635 RepID=A0A3L7DWQ1_9GAMM|nr:ECF-type sigma factor [Seongchinamella sediminis]RLQ21205.1 sigma-70 family RNA polymerase sigma factor [Seongchinamella sediminis]